MAATLKGPLSWKVTRDGEGHRVYTLVMLVETNDKADGPATVTYAAGLPAPGDQWVIGNDYDPWAYCQWDIGVEPYFSDGTPNYWFMLTYRFSTRGFNIGDGRGPDGMGQGDGPPSKSCRDGQFEDPLMEPARVSGSSIRYTEPGNYDRHGDPIQTSSYEKIRGANNEWDKSRGQVTVTINQQYLYLSQLESFVDCVNSVAIWGYNPRCVKFSSYTWEKKYYGTCQAYYTITMVFDTNTNTFDRDITDEGTKALHGRWVTPSGTATGQALWELIPIDGADPNPKNPSHFDQYIDRYANPTSVILNGFGVPAESLVGTVNQYVCIAQTSTGDNPSTATSKWIQLTGGGPASVYESSRTYSEGDRVKAIPLGGSLPSIFVAAQDSPADLNVSETGWIEFAGWTRYMGAWQNTVTYAKGNIVAYGESLSPGVIHVEKYFEANFLLLGVPTTL